MRRNCRTQINHLSRTLKTRSRRGLISSIGQERSEGAAEVETRTRSDGMTSVAANAAPPGAVVTLGEV